jgi:hypothetical protein
VVLEQRRPCRRVQWRDGVETRKQADRPHAPAGGRRQCVLVGPKRSWLFVAANQSAQTLNDARQSQGQVRRRESLPSSPSSKGSRVSRLEVTRRESDGVWKLTRGVALAC